MTVDLHSLAAPYALDALDPLERVRFEGHLDTCADCRAELFGFAETAALLGASQGEAPSASLRASILAHASTTSQERVLRPLPGRLRRILPRLAVAAALLVGAAGAGGYAIEHERMTDQRDRVVAMEGVLGASDASTHTEKYARGGTVRLVSSASHDSAVVVASGLPKLSDDRVYQLWMITDEAPASQGTFRSGGSMVMKDIDRADSVAITVEPKGGSEQPTTDPVVGIDL